MINYSEHPTFRRSYQGDPLAVPHAVMLTGYLGDEKCLGVGNVIGEIAINERVIEVEDVSDGVTYEVLASDCIIVDPIPAFAIDEMASGAMALGSVRQYLETLREEDEREANEMQWFYDNGIDPNDL